METLGLFAGVVVSFAVAAVVRWVWGIVYWVWVKPKRLERYLRKQGFEGKSYRLLFGDLKEETKMREEARSHPITFSNDIVARVVPFPHKLLKTHGKNFFTWSGPKPRVNIAEPEQIKTIFCNISEFERPDRPPQFGLLLCGLVTYGGSKWAKHRKIINPAFHSEKLKLMWPAFYQSCSEMISEWEKLIGKGDNRCELDIWPSLQTLTKDVISRTAFGNSYKEGEVIFDLQKKLAQLVIQAVQSGTIPGWRFLPTKLNRKIKEIDGKMQDLLVDLVRRRENAMKAGESREDDLLSILIESNWEEIKEHGNDERVGMSMQDVIDECKLFYLAGQETTSSLIVWAIILLSIHQEWQDKARTEVLQVFGFDKPGVEGLNHLKIVTMILHEVLRLYPPVIMVNRKVEKETRLGSLSLPQGALVCVQTLMLHQDPELWGDDAHEFKPERFSEGVSKATKSQTSFLPFGWGPRICIGQNFAMIESKMAISLILQRFSFEISPSYAHAPYTLVSLQPQHGAQIILKKLSST